MQKQDLEQFHAWFDSYVSTFYGHDEYINTNLKLKEEHSRLVCEQARYLAGELNLSENQKLLAETIALFHDVGRFKQFVKYKTYNDPKSINHSELAIEVLEKNKVLDILDPKDAEIVNTAIKLHNVKELPANLDDRISLQAKLIRDADKIDIYRVS
jgi:HD superfamily phosphodiesterase